MSSNTWISVGVGVLAAVAIVASGGTATAALWAFSLGATATSLVLGPDTPKQGGTLRPDEIQINQSAEDATIPVVFGTSRVPANFIFVGFDEFEATAVYSQAQGGKGGAPEPQQTGYKYTVPLHYGICMGEIDALLRVVGSPGLDEMFKGPDGGLTFTGGMAETIDIRWSKTQGQQTAVEGGSCQFYPGSATQGNDLATTDTNHRHVCFVAFPSYTMTGSPAPRSLLFEIRRLPKVLFSDGTPVPSFPTRAALNNTFPEYYDANPAAVAWEILQNPVWGKGMHTDALVADEFRLAADYYQRARIGLSTTTGKGTLNDLMARLRDIFGLWVWWDGSRMRCRCMYDRTTAYEPRSRLTAEDIVGTPQFNRPSLSGTYNEIRLEFTNRENNWQSEVATAMDLAHVETVSGIRTQTIDAAEIGTRRAAELMAHTMLRQMAYPGATCQVQLRRAYSGLQPGSFVELLWEEWRETGVATTFWRVVDVSDDDQAAEGLTLTLAEDLYATAVDGELADGDFTAPVPTIDEDIPLENDDLVDGDLTGARPVGSLRPVVLWEPNSWASAMNRAILVAPTREKGYVQSVSLAWRLLAESTSLPLQVASVLPINGRLLDAISGTGVRLCRDGALEFDVELYVAANAPRMEAATGLVQGPADHFAELTRALDAMMLIGNEIFRVGFCEETSPGVVTVRTYMRAELGSVLEAHAIDDDVVFFPSFNPQVFTPATAIPTTQEVKILLTANTINGTPEGITTSDQAPILGGVTFDGRSLRPFAPEVILAQRTGTTWTLRLRPRVWFGGAGYRGNLEDDLTTYVTELTGLLLRFQKSSGGDIVTLPAGDSFTTPPFTMPATLSVDSLTWHPDNGTATGGTLDVQITFDANPTALQVWAVRNSYESELVLSIPQP